MAEGRSAMPPAVLTIGHSNHPLDRFVALLARHGVEALVDNGWPGARTLKRRRCSAASASCWAATCRLGRAMRAWVLVAPADDKSGRSSPQWRNRRPAGIIRRADQAPDLMGMAHERPQPD